MDSQALRPLMLLVLAALILVRGLRVVREPERLIVFRLGRLRRLAGPGLVWLLPWLDSGVRVNLDEVVPRWRSLAPETAPARLLAWICLRVPTRFFD